VPACKRNIVRLNERSIEKIAHCYAVSRLKTRRYFKCSTNASGGIVIV